MNGYAFWIRRTHGTSYERIVMWARDSQHAISKLPPCVSWDFGELGPLERQFEERLQAMENVVELYAMY